MLAYYHYPFVPNQKCREYTRDELMKPEIVEELFDYCQILEAYITKKRLGFFNNQCLQKECLFYSG